MKNIHILKTDKPSRLYINLLTDKLFILENSFMDVSECNREYQNIYITSDEEIKEGDWFIDDNNQISHSYRLSHVKFANPKKIILTTDQDLIKDGVQAIDDEFLEWFVNNPSFEYVKVIDKMKIFNVDELRERHRNGLPHLYSEKIAYKIIIPKEETKQTAVEWLYNHLFPKQLDGFSDEEWNKIDLAFNQAKEMEKQQIGYSEEEVLKFTQTMLMQYKFGNTDIEQLDLLKETLQQFKNK